MIEKVISSPAQIELSESLLDKAGIIGVKTPISKDVLTLFDKSVSPGIVILAVMVYGAEGSDKSSGAKLAPATATKCVGKIKVCEPPSAMDATTLILY